ncbi:tail fiber assembly protein [Erwinia sp. Eh17-17]|uniref:tail fiber assembly protein n=1 Tax=Erwinia sp. Eh17-17 TaxID=3080330 RepID=UPI0032098832
MKAEQQIVQFSPSVQAFYPQNMIDDGSYGNELPADLIGLTGDELVRYWKQTPPTGKCLGLISGRPAWVDIPSPTREELIATAEQRRQRLLAHADAIMADWRTELMLGEISDTNKGKLSAWLAYKNEVKSADVTTDPEHVNWPVPPEA